MNMDLELPGGVITTHCVSSVIRPGSKVTHDPLQFVKIQSAELSKKAVEQIRLAEEVKITKDKIKEVEEEWQNNLLNWKSKRRQSRTTTNCSLTDTDGDPENEDDGHPNNYFSHHHHHHHHNLSHHHLSHHHLSNHHHSHHHHLHHHHSHHHHLNDDDQSNRKIKTFSEILNEKAKSGYRIGYNLHKYIRNGSEEDDDEEEEEDEDDNKMMMMMEDDVTSRLSSSSSSDDSRDKKIIKQSTTESQSTPSTTTTTTTTTNTQDDSYSGSMMIATADGDNDDDDKDDDDENDGDDEGALDNVDDRSPPPPPPSTKLVNEKTVNLIVQKVPLDNELINQGKEQQSYVNYNGKQLTTTNDDCQPINLNNGNGNKLDYQKPVNNQLGLPTISKKLLLKPSLSLPPLQQSKLINKPTIYKINSYNDSINQNNGNDNTTIGKKVILKFKIDKDISRQSSLPLLSSSSSSASPSSSSSSSSSTTTLTATSADRDEIISKRFSSSENQIKEIKVNQGGEEISEPRLSFRDKLSNFESLSKDLTSSTNHLNHHHHLSKVKKITETSSSSSPSSSSSSSSSNSANCDIETINCSSSSTTSTSESEIINEIKVNQEPRLSFRDKLSNFESLAKGEEINGLSIPSSSSSSSSLTNHPGNPNHQPYLSKDRKLTELASSSSSLSSLSSSSTRISGHQTLTSSLSSSSLTNHPPHPHPHDEQIKKDNDLISSTKLGEKSSSEAQLLLMKKSNDNLKVNQDQQRSMLSISGKKRCSNCGDELGRGCAAMVIETLSLYYHINCFRCSVCHIQLGNGTCGTDVRVRSNRLHCQNCYSNDEVGLTRV